MYPRRLQIIVKLIKLLQIILYIHYCWLGLLFFRESSDAVFALNSVELFEMNSVEFFEIILKLFGDKTSSTNIGHSERMVITQ